MRLFFILITLFCGSLFIKGQTAADTITITKELQDVEIVFRRPKPMVEQDAATMVVDAAQIQKMPKFLGTSDPIRYMQSLAGVQTNSETTAGIHIQGCDDYHTLISINDAPLFYPNHLLGLYSTFISQHFSTITIEQAEHTGVMPNRIGGLVDFQTHNTIPQRFGIEANVGIINSDATMKIPVGQKNAFFISGRSSYLGWLYGLLADMTNMNMKYHFQDYNLTYLSQPTDKDEVVVTGFYSRDKAQLKADNMGINVPWQNILGSAYWNRKLNKGNWRTNVFYSAFLSHVEMGTTSASAQSNQMMSVLGCHNQWDNNLLSNLALSARLDYEHYFNQPFEFRFEGMQLYAMDSTYILNHADELSLAADLKHDVNHFFSYNIGLHGSLYMNGGHYYPTIDPRVSFHFVPAAHHLISLHYGIYHQTFHKTSLLNGGMPVDFFFLADDKFVPETAHAVNLKYLTSFLNKKYEISAELYFKQIYNITESTGNVLSLLNGSFNYKDEIINGNGRNYGLNLMFQRNKGIVTGYVSYTLGWATRSLPQLEGYTDYRYSSSSERRHDLKIVLNSNFAKRWNVSAMFVLATGIPYTRAEEAYLYNGEVICRYSSYNGSHLPLYHRLDLSCSCDIVQRQDLNFGINLSLYNTYANHNAQFIVYSDKLSPIYGSSLSTIIPSVSFYLKFE